MSKYYLTTPIYYVNDRPHIGHAYTTIVADALARFHRLQGDEVFFSVGVDENSQKNVQAMEKAGEKDLHQYLDRMARAWKETWQDLGITFNEFIRTTEERHRKGVERFWEAVQKNGDIELRDYESWYCVGCEAFKTETEIVDGKCPLHPNKPLERLKEKNYFFKLSKYRERLLALYQDDHFVMPEARRNEIRNYVKDHMEDISISREAKHLNVGIPVPGDESQRIYVWFDALLNYLTIVGYGMDEMLFKKWWPTDLWVGGKDIIKFHAALFPAMLMSAAKNDSLLQDKKGQPLLLKLVYAHGFFTIDGQKISKSLGNAIDPRDITAKYGNDTLRYFLLREIPFGEDGDFSETRLQERYQSDLGNTLGNLVNRVIAMSKKYFDGKVSTKDSVEAWSGSWMTGEKEMSSLVNEAEKGYASARCDHALGAVWGSRDIAGVAIFNANLFIQETEPFKKGNEARRAGIIYELLEACRIYAWLLHPVMPHITCEVWKQLGLDSQVELSKGWKEGTKWGGLKPGAPLGEPQPLFPRLPD